MTNGPTVRFVIMSSFRQEVREFSRSYGLVDLIGKLPHGNPRFGEAFAASSNEKLTFAVARLIIRGRFACRRYKITCVGRFHPQQLLDEQNFL